MPRTTNIERIHLHLVISTAVKKRLEALQTMTEAESLTEVIRRALAVYEALIEVRNRGGRVILEDEKRKSETLRII